MSQVAADRNLLFGILAVQMDFLTRDQLIAGMNAWILNKRQTLGQVLLNQNVLAVDTHALLEALVQKHLALHESDPQQSLASVGALDWLRRDLAQFGDPEVDRSLARVTVGHGEDGAQGQASGTAQDPHATLSFALGTSTSVGARFRILRPHARGGLGEVFVAHDEELHREVALKEIQDRHAGDLLSRSRFLLEAEITGGLEHPGIVPVYGLGTHSDGRPFYAMRFIRGDSLKDAIQRFHAAEAPARDPGERSLALRKLLGRFVDVCNAMAYAHSRGVLHRDLKPGNIMLGKYGETLVVDWGLAKALDRPDLPDLAEERPLRPSSASASTETQAGTAIGTPPFMSPEQAAGRLDLLGPASDVYSLGATLYCLLTGRLPFEDRDVGVVLTKVQRGDFPRPSQVCPGIPRALEAVCLKAMALKPAERYDSARALADDVEHWLADEPVTAWPEPWTVRTRRWVGRNRVLVTAAAAALLVLLVGGFGGGLWYVNDRAYRQAEREGRQKHVNRELTAALDEAEALLKDLRGRLDDPHRVHVFLSAIADWKVLLDRASQARQRAQAVAAGQEDVVEPRPAERLQALAGRLQEEQTAYALGRAFDDLRLEAAVPLAGSVDYWRVAQKYPAVFARAGLVLEQDEPARIAARIARLPARYALVAALDDWALVTANPLRARLLEVARRADPNPWRDRFRDDKLWSNRAALERLAREVRPEEQSPQVLLSLALALKGAGGDGAAVLRPALLHHPRNFWLYFVLGSFVKDPVEEMWCYQAALAIRPQSGIAYHNLGNGLRAKKDLHGALIAYRKAVLLDPNFAPAHLGVARVLFAQKDVDGGILACRAAIQLDPTSAQAQCDLGAALYAQKDLEGALRAMHKAVQLDPNLALAHNGVGSILHANKDLEGALAAFHKALQLDPTLAQAHSNLGIVLYDKKDLDGALRAFRKAVQLDPSFADAQHLLAKALYERKDLEAAIPELRKAIKLDPNRALAHHQLGTALADRRKVDEAIPELRKAIELDPNAVFTYGALGQALLLKGRFDEARQATLQCLKLLPANHPVRPRAQQQLAQCQHFLALDAKLAAFLRGAAAPPGIAEQLALADLCRGYKHYYAVAVRLLAGVFAVQPALADDLPRGLRYQASCLAVLAAAGKGLDPKKPDEVEKNRLRTQALEWLQTDLDRFARHAQAGRPEMVVLLLDRLTAWGKNPDLASVREPSGLAVLPAAEQAPWRKLWADVELLVKQVNARITRTALQGTLTANEREHNHELKVTAGKTYVIDMHSTDLDSYLKLLDAGGKVLAENDDVAPGNQDARLLFTPPADATCRIVATSLEGRGTGAYVLTIRAIGKAK